MKVHVHLDLYKLANIGASFNEVNFTQITEKVGFYEDYQEVKRLRIRYVSGNPQIDYYNVDLLPIPSGQLIGNDVMLLSDIRPTSVLSSIEFFAEYDNATNLKALITAGVITLGITGYTVIELYRLNDKRNVLSKTKVFIGYIDGQFKNPISIKNFSIDVIDYPLNSTYNYVYIPKLGRYYYINDIAFVSKDLTRINLVEDVLSSWESLIRRQSAFVSRYGGTTSRKIVDNRYPLENIMTTEYITPTNSASSLINVTLKSNFVATDYNYLVSVNGEALFTKSNVTPPTSSNLPEISPIQSKASIVYFLTYERLTNLMNALIDDDTKVSFINSIVFLPFIPDTPFNVSKTNPLLLGLPTGVVLCDDDKFHPLYNIPSGVTAFSDIGRTTLGTSAYLVIADFSFSSSIGNKDLWYDYEPYANYEIYVPFVGWVQVSLSAVGGKRILIYYDVNFQTGNATAYIYNYTDSRVIWSGGCQLGVKLDILSSNALELSRERQATELNTLIGLVASAVSIGAGVITENPVAVAGGVLSAGKTIASAVNSERMRFERGQVTYGSGEAGLHSKLDVVIRKTYNKRLITATDEENRYKALQGYPYNKYETLTSLSGYVEIGDIQFNTIDSDIYNIEIDEIIALLKSGVIM